jgi:hypothetical protein
MRYRLALLGLLLPLPAFAMSDAPSETDLKAAYCIETIQIELSAQRGAVLRGQKLDRQITDAQDRLNRLQSYLLPRLDHLDAAGSQVPPQRMHQARAASVLSVKRREMARRLRAD